jgi:ABC-type molybdate transport system substrate-binding protein
MATPYSYNANNESNPVATSGAGGGIGATNITVGGNPNLIALANNKTLQYAMIAGAIAVVLFVVWKRK